MANPARIPSEMPSLIGLVDAVDQRLTQAHATASMLMLSLDESFCWKEVSNVLWAVTTLLEQATQAVGNAHAGYSAAIDHLKRQNQEQAATLHRLKTEQAALSAETAAVLKDAHALIRQNPHLLAGSPRFACPMWDLSKLAVLHENNAETLRK